MKKEQKAQNIEILQKEFTESSIGILTDYRGLKTAELDGLRRKMQESGGNYKIVKNTLAIKASEKLNRPEIQTFFKGPVAIAFGTGEVQDTARIFADYIRNTKITIPIKGGFMGEQILTSEDITTLSTLPPKETLIAQVIGGIKSPLYSLASVLAAPIRNLQGVLQARIKQLEDTN